VKKDDIDALVGLGAAQRRAGELAAATTTFQKAVAAAPKDKQAHYDLGVCYSDAGRLDDAVKEIKTATQIDPKYALAWRRLASVELKRNACSEAKAAFDQFFKLAPKQPRGEADAALKGCKPHPQGRAP
jgi:Flp pilus assembly protein TadD